MRCLCIAQNLATIALHINQYVYNCAMIKPMLYLKSLPGEPLSLYNATFLPRLRRCNAAVAIEATSRSRGGVRPLILT